MRTPAKLRSLDAEWNLIRISFICRVGASIAVVNPELYTLELLEHRSRFKGDEPRA